MICEKHEKAPRKAGQELKLYRIITETDSPKYQVRFKILEAFGQLFK